MHVLNERNFVRRNCYMKRNCLSIFFILIFNFCAKDLFSQTIEERLLKASDCDTMLMYAMVILPELYKKNSLDSLHTAVEIWERWCGARLEVKTTRILLDIEESRSGFSRNVDANTIDLLSNYARFLSDHAQGRPYTTSQASFFRFATAWSKLLLENKPLDENEKFICRVLSGEIKEPEKEIRKNS